MHCNGTFNTVNASEMLVIHHCSDNTQRIRQRMPVGSTEKYTVACERRLSIVLNENVPYNYYH